MRRALPLLLSGMVLALSDCAPAHRAKSTANSYDPIASVARPRTRSDLLTETEIQQSQALNAFDVIARLRPGWLRNRGEGMIDPDGSMQVQVWYNGRHLGPPPVLEKYDIAQIISMRYVDPITARSTYGSGNGRGVIAVVGR